MQDLQDMTQRAFSFLRVYRYCQDMNEVGKYRISRLTFLQVRLKIRCC